MTLLGVLVCILIADAITGLAHWFEDTYGNPRWPGFLGTVIEENIEHHRDPGLMGRMGTFLTRNWREWIYAISGAGLLWLIGIHPGYALLTFLIASFGNEVHSWNHRTRNNWLVTFLQDTALLQTRQQHLRHHKKPYSKTYCVILNVNNAWMDLIGFWRGLEWVIARFGVKPTRCTEVRSGY